MLHPDEHGVGLRTGNGAAVVQGGHGLSTASVAEAWELRTGQTHQQIWRQGRRDGWARVRRQQGDISDCAGVVLGLGIASESVENSFGAAGLNGDVAWWRLR
ncbi:hypothetical protein M0R45_006659 [Rubus argutus]|uniref:MHC class I antigen n=1 Tax=Rubus argutus TaxID=59490 RepID=A0AAW1YRS0_RUBAR